MTSQVQLVAAKDHSITPSAVAAGQCLGFLPAAVCPAAANTDRLRGIMRSARQQKTSTTCDSSLTIVKNFGNVAKALDEADEEHGGNLECQRKYAALGHPYVVDYEFSPTFRFFLGMSPFMASVVAQAEFIECDITFNESVEYPYLLNVVAYDSIASQWMVSARARLTKQDAESHRLAFSSIISWVRHYHPTFAIGPDATCKGVVMDYSDAASKGLSMVIGEYAARGVLKGCHVHWLRSVRKVGMKIAGGKDTLSFRAFFCGGKDCVIVYHSSRSRTGV